MHLTPNFFSLNWIYLLFQAFGRRNFWICLNPGFYMPYQSRSWSVARPSFRDSGAAVADDIYPDERKKSWLVRFNELLNPFFWLVSNLSVKSKPFCLQAMERVSFISFLCCSWRELAIMHHMSVITPLFRIISDQIMEVKAGIWLPDTWLRS